MLNNTTNLVAWMDDDVTYYDNSINHMIKFWDSIDSKTVGVGFNMIYQSKKFFEIPFGEKTNHKFIIIEFFKIIEVMVGNFKILKGAAVNMHRIQYFCEKKFHGTVIFIQTSFLDIFLIA